MTAAQLRTIRKRLGLTQVQLAAELGVDANTVARWEQGTRGISEPVAKLIQVLASSSPMGKKGRKPRRKR